MLVGFLCVTLAGFKIRFIQWGNIYRSFHLNRIEAKGVQKWIIYIVPYGTKLARSIGKGLTTLLILIISRGMHYLYLQGIQHK